MKAIPGALAMTAALGAAALCYWLCDAPWDARMAVAFMTAALVFFCFFFDASDDGEHDQVGKDGNFGVVALRMVAQKIKLVLRLTFWFAADFCTLMLALRWAARGSSNIHVSGGRRPAASDGGFVGLLDQVTAPILWMVDGFAAILGALALLLLIFFQGELDSIGRHPAAWGAVAVGLYLAWLWAAAKYIVRTEYSSDRTGDEYSAAFLRGRTILAIGAWAAQIAAIALGIGTTAN